MLSYFQYEQASNFQLAGTTPILLHNISKHQLREQLASKGAMLSLEEEALEVMTKDDDGNPVSSCFLALECSQSWLFTDYS